MGGMGGRGGGHSCVHITAACIIIVIVITISLIFNRVKELGR